VTDVPTDPFDHLDERIRAAALAEDQKRLELISRDWWISYPPGEDIILRLFELHDLPQRQRPPSLVVYAPPNSGKTAIIARFKALYAGRVARREADCDGVVVIQAPPTVDEKRLYLEILRSIGAAAPETTTARLRTIVINQLRQRRTRLLIIDEMQHALGQRARPNRHSPHPDHGSGDMDEGEVVAGEPVEPGGEAPEMLELVEATLDAIAQLVDHRVVRDRGLSRTGRGNDGLGSDPGQTGAQAVGVIGAVREDGLGPVALQKRRDGEDVVALARRDQEPHRSPERVAGHVDLGRQSASGTPHSRIEAPLFEPLPRPVVAC